MDASCQVVGGELAYLDKVAKRREMTNGDQSSPRVSLGKIKEGSQIGLREGINE